MYSSEHGQSNDDEFNLIEAGRNYGWPDVQGACNTSSEQEFCAEWNVMEPLAAWSPCIAVNGLEYYTHEAIPEFQGKILMAVLGGLSAQYERMTVLELAEDGLSVVSEDSYFSSFNQRIRDIAVNPYTGAFYLAFNGTSYPGSPPNIIKEFSTSNPAGVPSPVVRPLALRPIPASGQVEVSVTEGAIGGPFSVRDMSGRLVLESTVPSSVFTLPLDGWPTGRYIVWTAVGAADLLVD